MLSIQEARESRKEKNGNFKGKEGFPGGSSDKESACNAGAAGATGSVPGSGRSPEEEMATHSSILAWEFPWTEKPGGLQSTGSQESDTTKRLNHHHQNGYVYHRLCSAINS